MSTRRVLLARLSALGESIKRIDCSIRYRSKVRRLLSRVGPPPVWSESDVSDAKNSLRNYHPRYRRLEWHQLYEKINDIRSPSYLPEDLFYSVVERALNPRSRIATYRNKNLYETIGLLCPTVVARIVRGRLLSSKFEPMSAKSLLEAPGLTEVVVKPALDSGLGRNVVFVEIGELESLLEQIGISAASGDYVLEAPIRQSPAMAHLNESSVNTVRVMTARIRGGGIVHLSSVVRIGRAGSRIDNQGAGGIACGVEDSGRMRQFAVDRDMNKYERHPDSGVRFAGLQVPRYAEAVELCRNLHGTIPDMDLISWDVALEETDKPRLIELNVVGQEINFHQACNGPIFSSIIDDVCEVAKVRMVMGLPI